MNFSDKGMRRRIPSVAFAALAAAGVLGPVAAQAAAEPDEVAEVVVTATKRDERLQEVPLSVAVKTAQDLEVLNASSLVGYMDTVPGVSFIEQGPGQNELVIRGFSSPTPNGTVSPVGYYIDELAQTDEEQSDLELYDVRAIEILRGPQGTLYGEGSLGGTVKITTNAPDLEDFDYSADAELSRTEGGGDGHALRGMVNVPLVKERLGLRVVAWDREMPGWIDSVSLGREDVNDAAVRGARATLRWQASEDLQIDFRAVRQELRTGAPQQQNPVLGQDIVDLPAEQHTNQDFTQFGLTANWNLGFATLTSVTGYYERTQDNTTLLSDGVDLLINYNDTGVKIWSNETRLVSERHERYDWVAGVFYMKRDDNVVQIVDYQASGDPYFSVEGGYQRVQYAAFGELNFRPVPPLQLTAGLRYSIEENDLHLPFVLGFLGGLVIPNDKSTDDRALVPKLSASWKFDEDRLAYATVAKGFRSGGNIFVPPAFLPVGFDKTAFDPDYAWNYELGFKSQWFDRRLTLNAAVYYGAWENIQVPFESPTFPGTVYTANAGKAHTQGFEVELQARPIRGLNLQAALGVTDAEFDEAVPDLGVVEGTKLSGVATPLASAGFDYTWTIAEGVDGFLAANWRYNGKSLSAYSGVTGVDPLERKSYQLVNVQIGLDASRWSLRVFADNLLNERAIIGYEQFNGTVPLEYVNQPRRVGVRLSLRR